MSWSGCRDVFHGDDLVLLTKHRPPSDIGRSCTPPTVHLLGLIDKVEKDDKGGFARIAHVHLWLGGGTAQGGFPLQLLRQTQVCQAEKP